MCKHHQTLESLRANAFLGYIDKLVQLIYIYHDGWCIRFRIPTSHKNIYSSYGELQQTRLKLASYANRTTTCGVEHKLFMGKHLTTIPKVMHSNCAGAATYVKRVMCIAIACELAIIDAVM